MYTTRRFAMLYLLGITILLYGWIFLFGENAWMRALGVSVVSIIVGSLSFKRIYHAFCNRLNPQRYFWLILNIGVFFYILFNCIWLYEIIVLKRAYYSDEVNIVWNISLICYLFALFYKLKMICKISTVTNRYIFNIVIFMASAVTISAHYLLQKIYSLAENSIIIALVILAYPILSLSTLLATISVVYLSRYSNGRDKCSINYMFIGFTIKSIGDFIYLFQEGLGIYEIAGYIDPLWIVGVGLLGFCFEDMKISPQLFSGNKEEKWNNYVSIFPYLSSLLLMILLIDYHRWEMNSLFIGLFIIYLLVMSRQLFLLQKNYHLMQKYKGLAYLDSLTGLYNRTRFKSSLRSMLEDAQQRDSQVGVILIDLDRFKNINDSLGHHIGDKLLIEVANRLMKTLNQEDKCFRLGGDEFVITLSGTSTTHCAIVAEKILHMFSKPFQIEEYSIAVTPSIGISMYPDNGDNSYTLFKHADAAMYLAKEKGKNNYRFFNKKICKTIERKILIENGLKGAIQNKELHIVYHPKVILQSREIYGMEALLRWEHPSLGNVSPAEFIPIAEETGQIGEIGEWMLRNACKQAEIWHENGLPPLIISVNVSVKQFQHGDFYQTVKGILQETRLNPNYLELEITESIMQNIGESIMVLKKLKELGVKTSIDDFGTGYSSLYMLKELPIDTIKIDKSFIDNIIDKKDQYMIKTIIELGMNLNLYVVAAGIETEEQLSLLKEYNCQFGQGYIFSQPLNEVEFENLLCSNN